MADGAVQLTIRLLGVPEARIAGVPLILHHQKARALLYYLAASGHSHTRDHLATLLWSESAESNARHSLRSSLYHIRQALPIKGANEMLIGDGDLVYLRLDRDACDVTHFRQLLVEGSDHTIAEAASLYRGPLLQDFTLTDAPLFEQWARFEASTLRQAYLGALQRLATRAEQRQAWEEAITYLQRIVQLDSLFEEAQQRLIGLYMHTGAIGQALRQYQQFEIELRQELGLTPSRETQDLVSTALEARRYDLQVLDELTQDKGSAETADSLHHLLDLLAQTASTHEMLHLTSALAQVYQSLGKLEQAAFWWRQHYELAYKTAGPAAQSAAHFELGELALVANDHRAAAAAARAGLAIDIPVEDPQRMALVARGHRLLGAALAMEGSNLVAAESHLQEAVAAHRLTNNTSDLCATLFELGNVAAQRGELKRALEFYAEAAHTAEGANVHYFLALAYNNFAYHSLLLGHLEAAQRALTQGRQLAETYEMSGALLHLYSTQGEIHLYLGEWAAASEAFQHGLTLAEELGNLERQAGYRAGLALVARGQNDLEAATTLLEEALTLISEQGYCHLWTRIQLWLAETLLLREHDNEAESHLNAALEMAQAHSRMLLLLQGERLHARLLATRNEWPAANALFARALDRASSLGLSMEIARSKAAWGEMALLHAQTPNNGYTLVAEAREALKAYEARAELSVLMVALKH